jgi:transcriptional regulator with XRE-family HTH domain
MKLSVRAEIRRRAGLTQHGLTKLTGISDTRISLWENGEIELPEGDVKKIAQAIEQEFERRPARLTSRGILRTLRLESPKRSFKQGGPAKSTGQSVI